MCYIIDSFHFPTLFLYFLKNQGELVLPNSLALARLSIDVVGSAPRAKKQTRGVLGSLSLHMCSKSSIGGSSYSGPNDSSSTDK